MDVEEYRGEIVFGATEEDVKKVEKEFNVKVNLNKPNDPLNIHTFNEFYTDVRVKWKEPRHVLVLDIICLTKSYLGPNNFTFYRGFVSMFVCFPIWGPRPWTPDRV